MLAKSVTFDGSHSLYKLAYKGNLPYKMKRYFIDPEISMEKENKVLPMAHKVTLEDSGYHLKNLWQDSVWV